MAKPRKMSDAQKLRILERQRAKHAAAIARVNAKIEACETCSTDKLQRDLGRLDADYQRDRKALESKYGVTLPSKPSAKKTAKKTAKKKTAKKKTAKKVNAQSGKSPKKKAAKKAAKAGSKAKAGKKRGKKSLPRSKPASFMVHVYDSAADVRPVWSGPLSQYMDDNADAIDDATAAKIWGLAPGKTIKVDLGAGGLSKIRRAKSEYRG